MNSISKRLRGTRSASSLSPTTKLIRGLPIEIQNKVKERVHPIDLKQLDKSHNELMKLKATLLRDFMLNLAAFSEANPECLYTIHFTNKYKDWEDADFTVLYNPEESSPSSRPNANKFNIARFMRSAYGSKSTGTAQRMQRNDINLDMSTRFDYIARTTNISIAMKDFSDEQRKQFIDIVRTMKQRVFPEATLQQSGGRREKRV